MGACTSIVKQESASLITSKMAAILVIPESRLVQEVLVQALTMETRTSKSWVTSWYSETKTDLQTLETSRRFVDQ